MREEMIALAEGVLRRDIDEGDNFLSCEEVRAISWLIDIAKNAGEATERADFACPKCGSTSLRVVVETNLYQDLETEVDGCTHEWDGSSAMECKACGHSGIADGFDAAKRQQENGPESNCAKCGTPLEGKPVVEEETEDGGTWRYCSTECMEAH